MNETKHGLLVAIDASEASRKAVRYVASLLRGRTDVMIELLHVLPPLPPALLEFGGREDPKQEQVEEARLHAGQEDWVKEQCRQAEPLFQEMAALLKQVGLPAGCIRSCHCSCAHRQEIVNGIIEAAKARRCGTIVVGRTAFHGLHKLFGHHIADRLIRQSSGLTVWVVE